MKHKLNQHLTILENDHIEYIVHKHPCSLLKKKNKLL